jgi:hypothetical protein
MSEIADQKTERTALEKVRRHIRILIEVGRITGDNELTSFLSQAVLQVARAVEIDHVKVLQYRRRTADLLVVAWASAGQTELSGARFCQVICVRLLGARFKPANRSLYKIFISKMSMCLPLC